MLTVLKMLILLGSIHFALNGEESLVGEPSRFTSAVNLEVLKQLPFDQTIDFEEAERGFIAPLSNEGVIKNEQGNNVWNLKNYSFLATDQPSPSTVNPSLWRQARLLDRSGLFKVTDRIYQVRGADLSNMTIIEGKEGLIIIDPLVSIETAKAALDLYYQNRPKKPVKALIYSHSHVDHFGGAKGVISQEDVDQKKIKVYAPEGFVNAALDENIMAGNAMSRRAMYMYGNLLKPGPKGQMTSGLGITTSTGEISLVLPTDLIGKTGEEREIDGVKFVFLFAPDSEAPAEMLFFIPELKALGMAEDASHTMHNLYSLRGAKVRDAKAWSTYLNEAIELFGAKTDVAFMQHHWPVWGNERVIDFLEKQRDMYKYIHDQTLHLANQGYTMIEIGEKIKLPDSLAKEWYNRGYYGSLNHNAKAVYNFYLGWFDGNPSTLHQLPPVPASKKYVEYMGGAKAVLEKARQDFNAGDYRWTAQVLNHLVFAEPANQEARDLLANTLEQLGYQAENATWRNFYLTGAQELRFGVKSFPAPNTGNNAFFAAMPMEMILDYQSIRLNGPEAGKSPLIVNLTLPDINEHFMLQIKNGVLNYFKGKTSDKADISLRINRADFIELVLGIKSVDNLMDEKKLTLEGSKDALIKFLSLFDTFNLWFNIVEPQKN